jgi:hypothetical protein
LTVLALAPLLMLHTFFREGYSNSENSWLRRADFAGSDMLNAFDIDADASDLLIEGHRDAVVQRKARIEEGTAQLQEEGMTYAAAYHKAFTMEFARGGKRIRNTTQPPLQR